MPWKGEKDPYRIWISEIILQQTRVEQGLNYYHRFIKAFPSIRQLAQARDEKVFKLWEGLGYYSRCRNLLHTARFINEMLDGKFPSSYDEIKKLKGIGPYTAAAISSFAYNLPYAVVDGNVNRVLARIFGIREPIDSVAGKKIFNSLAQELLDKKLPGLYNQAIMDFGATVCKPTAPLCPGCVFNKSCKAFLTGKVSELPTRNKKQKIKTRWFYYLVIGDLKNKNNTRYAIRKRVGKDIWQDLYEFPLYESEKQKNVGHILVEMEKKMDLLKNNYTLKTVSPVFTQQLSHQLISGQFISLEVKKGKAPGNDLIWVEKKKLSQYAFPRYINRFLGEHLINQPG